jgi:hypothetical protein
VIESKGKPMWEKVGSWRVLVMAVAFFVTVHVMDIASTLLAMAYVPGATESNPLFRDAETLKFLVRPAINIKVVYMLCQPALLSIFIWAGTGRYFLAALPWWYWGAEGLKILASNATILTLFGEFS